MHDDDDDESPLMTIRRPFRKPTLDSTELTGGLIIDLVEKRLLIDWLA